MYEDTSRFEIIHVPGFQTKKRLVNYYDEGPLMVAARNADPDVWFYMDRLPEFHPEIGTKVAMQWGPLYAKPESEVYTFEEFQEALSADIELFFDTTRQDLQKMLLLVYPEKEDPFVRVYVPEKHSLKTLLKEVQPRSSIIIGGMLLKGEGNREHFYAPDFVFHIGDAQENIAWEIQVQELENVEDRSPEKLVTEDFYQFDQYPLTELIAELSGQRINRIEFEDMPANPILKVEMKAPGLSSELAYVFIMNELQKEYRFTIERKRLPQGSLENPGRQSGQAIGGKVYE